MIFKAPNGQGQCLPCAHCAPCLCCTAPSCPRIHSRVQIQFTEGCAAACNGPYDGKWSKTMIGYGDEDTNFVLELTYNYGV